MEYLTIDNMKISRIALGCMRIAKLDEKQTKDLIITALNLGINFFDHADIYGQGKSEELFGSLLRDNPDLRNKMFIQTKCGICKGYYDLSYEHIIESVENSLKRLNTNYIDVLLLHRPDALVDPLEVARAFDKLYEDKKVRYFGVSNMNPYQIEIIKKYCKQPLKFNQLQFNVVNAGMVDSGINVNMNNKESIDHDGFVLDYCRLNDITIQPWSILQASWTKGTYLDHPEYENLNLVLEKLSRKYQVTKSAIALAWILKHPAKMQPILGTTSIEHLKEMVEAENIELTKQEWYELYLANNRLLP